MFPLLRLCASLLIALSAIACSAPSKTSKTVPIPSAAERDAKPAVVREWRDGVRIPTGDERLWAVAVDPSGKYIATGADDGTFRIYSTEDFSLVTSNNVSTHTIRDIAFSPDGKHFAVGSRDGLTYLGTVGTWEYKVAVEAGGPVYSVAYSPDSMWLATGCRPLDSSDPSVSVWRAADGSPVERPVPTSPATAVAFTEDGGHLIAALEVADPNFIVDTETWRKIRAFGSEGRWNGGVATRSNGLVAISWVPVADNMEIPESGTIELFESRALLETRVPKPKREIDTASVPGRLAFTPDAKRLVVTFQDAGVLRIYDAVTLDQLAEIECGRTPDFAITPDGKWLLTAGLRDGAMGIYALP